MNRRELIKALMASPAVWMASKYGIPNGGVLAETEVVIKVTSGIPNINMVTLFRLSGREWKVIGQMEPTEEKK